MLPGEDADEYEALAAALTDEYQPSTPTELFLVTEMAQAQWKLQRIANMEYEVLTGGQGTLGSRFAADCSQDQVLLKLNRYEQATRRNWYKALNQLRKMRSQDESRLREQTSREIDQILAEALTVPTLPVPPALAAPQQQICKTNPMPAHLQREFDAHKRRDPLFDPTLDRSQMSKALQKWFDAEHPSGS